MCVQRRHNPCLRTLLGCAGQRVAGEINCNLDPNFEHPDKVFIRNHAPKRTVLGIIGKDGCMSEFINLPIENLHKVRTT